MQRPARSFRCYCFCFFCNGEIGARWEAVVDLSGVAADPSAAFALIGSARVSITDARWLAEFAPTAKAVLKGDAGAFAKEILDSVSGGAKPNLKLIDNGGPSRA